MARRVAIVALPQLQPLDVTGPAEVLAAATELTAGDGPVYAVDVVAPGGAPIPTGSARARLALEDGAAPLDAIARRCGFGTVETLRRAFARRLGVPPAAYRSRFAA